MRASLIYLLLASTISFAACDKQEDDLNRPVSDSYRATNSAQDNAVASSQNTQRDRDYNGNSGDIETSRNTDTNTSTRTYDDTSKNGSMNSNERMSSSSSSSSSGN